MSIEIPLLLQYLEKLPLFSTKRSPQRFLQIPNGGFGKLNQKICRNIFAGKIELKNFWDGVFVKSLNLHTQFDQFGYHLPRTEASAADYHPSDESNGRNYEGKMNELLNLSINLPDDGYQTKEFESGFAAGTEFHAGNGQGGNGHGGGDGKGNNNDGHGGDSEGNDNNRLLTVTYLEWWWWLQWQRAHKNGSTQEDMAEYWGCNHTVWLADRTAQAMAEEMIKSLVLAMADMTEFLRLLDWDEIVSSVGGILLMVPSLFCFFYGEFPQIMVQWWYTSMGTILALAVVLSLVILWYLLKWWNCFDQEEDNDIGNDSLDDNGSL